MLAPFEENGKWGYKNDKLKIIVPPIYEEAYPTYNLRGRFKLNGKYGFIDSNGEVVIKPRYDKAGDFYNRICRVMKNGKEGYIDVNEKHPEKVANMCGGIYRYQLFLNEKMEFILKENEKYKLILKYAYREEGQLISGLDIVPVLFDSIYTLSRNDLILQKENKFYFFNSLRYSHDMKGRFMKVLEIEFEGIRFFNYYNWKNDFHSIFALNKNGRWAYFKLGRKHTLEKITEFKYVNVTTMNRGFAFVEYEKDKWGWASSEGVEYFRQP